MPGSLGAVQWDKYVALLTMLFPKACAFAVIGADGDLIWRSDPGLKFHAVDDASWHQSKSGLGRLSVADQYTDSRQQVRTGQTTSHVWLLVRHESNNGIAMQSADPVLKRAFDCAVSVLEDEVALQSECDQLAVELTERYEELNLVYSSDDQAEQSKESQEALSDLVYNCVDYLNVSLATLICRDKNLEIVSRARGVDADDVKKLQSIYSGKVYDWVEAHAEPIVVNTADDPLRAALSIPGQARIIAQPVIDDHNTIVGVLGIAKPVSAQEFSNGDRNLLEVMARKASHIIHTYHDSLTGLLNRGGFESMLLKGVTESRSDGSESCLMHVDIDQLHVINDTLGFAQGDAVLRKCSAVLRDVLRDTDAIGRLDGDEFGVLLPRCGLSGARNVARKIVERISALEVIVGDKLVAVSASVGIAPIKKGLDSVASLLAATEVALAEAKNAGQGQVVAFGKDESALVRRSEDVGWSIRIREAIDANQFSLFAQPVVPLNSDIQHTHYELLLRLFDAAGKLIPPNEFIPAAERYHLMPLIDRWVVSEALRALAEPDSGVADAVFCINLSGQSLTNPGFERFLIDSVNRAGPLARRLCFEVTETAAIANLDEAIQLIQSVKRFGCRFALDDFGAGLSSFGYLKVLPLDYLKIDGSIVKDVATDPISCSMVEAISSIGHAMNLRVIGEFVENDEIRQIIRDLGVDLGQGYGIGKPEPLQDLLHSMGGEKTA